MSMMSTLPFSRAKSRDSFERSREPSFFGPTRLDFARHSLSTEFILSACKAAEGLEKGGGGDASSRFEKGADA
jgi:hypothetical protein